MRTVKNLGLCVLLLALVSTATGTTLYVNTNGSGGAYTSIQAAIDAAGPGDKIEVAPGTYYEAINFNGKAVGLYSTSGPAVTTIDGDGCAHVVQCVSGEGLGTVLEGFTITGGNANSGEYLGSYGGGMCNYGSSPNVTNCIFTSNWALYGGGGMFNYEGSSPNVTNCIFTSNSTDFYGGGMFNSNCNPTITNCAFTGNSAQEGGGGMHNIDCSPTVTNCIFTGNSAYWGGGMCNFTSNPTVTNCIFTGNSADWGGGMYNCFFSPDVTDYAIPNVTNCVFTGNSAINGGGMLNDGYSSPNVTNCIFGHNSPNEMIEMTGGLTIVTYSDVQGGWTGVGNINTDPLFVDSANGNCRLQANSPCIDAGYNGVVTVTTDLDGNPRIQGAAVDMGAYEAPPATTETMLAGTALFIMEEVDSGNIDAEMEVSLLAKIKAAIAALHRGNPNDAKVAMNDLRALINQVEAQTDKKLTPTAAAKIIQCTNAIIAALGG